MEDKRLIEIDFPVKKVSDESAREKNIRHGHISTLHIWWARRPLASSRTTTFAALISAPRTEEDMKKKLDLIAKLSKWENSLDKRLIKNTRRIIRDSFGGKNPKILDCFAGGGAIALESLRLGCETYAMELNPVAVLILKAVLEYPQKFGRQEIKVAGNLKASQSIVNDLYSAVNKWAKWVKEQAEHEIGKFYPPHKDGRIPLGYIWARTVRCVNPSCGAEIPILRQLWLSNKPGKKTALKMLADKRTKAVKFEIARSKEIDFNPSQGTARQTTVLCPVCMAGLRTRDVRKQVSQGKMGQRLVAVVAVDPKKRGKTYRPASDLDHKIFAQAENYLESKIRNWKWKFTPLPDEAIPTPTGKIYEGPMDLFWVHMQTVLYGMVKWSDLFNSRQKLSMITFLEKVRLAYEEMRRSGYDPQFALAVTTYLALALDRLATFGSVLTRWESMRETPANVFGRQALRIMWDYVDINPFSGMTGGWDLAIYWVLSVIKHLSSVPMKPATVIQSDATKLPYDNDFFDAVVTDPPYYDSVPYSDLSDFFYVWLKRSIGDLYPNLFATPLTPKSAEIIQNSSLLRGSSFQDPDSGRPMLKDKEFFEKQIGKAFMEIRRVLKPNGVLILVFAHKSTDAWETIINALLKSGLVLTASWPIHTEMRSRLRAKESAALASSIYMVCRKRAKEEVAYFNDLKPLIDKKIREKLNQFWEQGIRGADFFVSAIGPAVEVFGRYSSVEKLSGEEVSVKELLDYVRRVVSEFALERVLKRADLGGVDVETRFYLLWRWTFNNAKIHFDDAIKLSRPMGVELTQLWDGGGFVKKEKEFVRVLGPKERAKDPAFLRKTKFTSMIDVIHHAVILWERGNKERIKEILDETGYAGNEIFWQTAQAISEVLPQGDKEKQLLQGFLYGKEAYIKEAARGKKTLLDFVED